MVKAFLRQNPTSLVWEYGTFKTDGITPDVELTAPAGLYRSRWQTVNGIVQLTILNANNIGELSPFRSIPITDVASDLIGTAYTDRTAFETATKDFFFRVSATVTNSSTGLKAQLRFRDGLLVIDKEITLLGFAGIQDTDWIFVMGETA